ncbi:serine/threonine-protein kinase [Nonomuraea fuscirosea]|uniref:WD40 repeat domain-containing serine/threonine protein kinase n=1 Tax=Nonomuraea fuscirosea TaxID=1291556 RepID=UPI002DD85025|nr:serine/threonine-protein kinase [Nonomuraea fuscirosea]WSA55460.1 serine/threonine-protein kinase [Nonomuraea fuscirosea]
MTGTRPLRPADPERVGAYRLVGVLGSGGQGVVYRGVSESGREVAVKLLHSHLAQDAAMARGFLREVEAARRVAAFCTAAVLDVGMLDERPYIVSEYVPGETLHALVRTSGPRSGGALDRLAISTLTALAAIHQAGIVHRDFKPANVLMGPDGPIVIDFGIAKALDATTRTSGVLGTPAYMSPEQFRGERVGPASDLFSWAGSMVYAATGRAAFAGDTMVVVMNAILNETPDLRGVPEHLAGLIADCLAKDPAARPAPADLLRNLIRQAGLTTPGNGETPSVDGIPSTGGSPLNDEPGAPGTPPHAVAPLNGDTPHTNGPAARSAPDTAEQQGGAGVGGGLDVGGGHGVFRGPEAGGAPQAGGGPGGGGGAEVGVGARGGRVGVSRRVLIGGGAAAVALGGSAFAVWRAGSGRREPVGGVPSGGATPVAGSPSPGEGGTASPSGDATPVGDATPTVGASQAVSPEPFGTPVTDLTPLPGGRVGGAAALAAAEGVVVCGTDKGLVFEWDPGAAPVRLGDGGGPVAAVAVGSLEGRTVAASGHSDGRMRLWGPAGESLASHRVSDPVIGVMVAGRAYAVSQKYDGMKDLHSVVRLWDVSTGKRIGAPITVHFQGIRGMAFGRVGKDDVLVTGDGGERIRVWRLSTATMLRTFTTGEIGGIEHLACGEMNGRPVLVSTHLDATLRVYDLSTGKRRKRWSFSRQSPDDRFATALAVGVAGKVPVAAVAHAPAGGESFVRVWDLRDGDVIGVLGAGEGGAIRRLAVTQQDGNPVVAGADEDGSLRLWSLGRP